MNRKPEPKIPPFLNKLYEIVTCKENKDTVTWNQDGDAFIIINLSDFCERILPYYFKHSNFASFVRQLNMYDFHKSKQNNNEQEFQHLSFRKDARHLLVNIKRKTNSEVINNIKTPSFRKRKLDMEDIKKEAGNIWNAVNVLKERVDILEGKHSFLEFCHSDLAAWNQKIKLQLNSLAEKEKNLENLLLFAIKNFAPNFFLKGNDIKYLENLIPDTSKDTQFIEKPSFQKGDIVNKIFKEIKNLIQCYYLVNNEGTHSTTDTETKSNYLAGKERSLLNNIKTNFTSIKEPLSDENKLHEALLGRSSVDIQNELNYFTQLFDFQKRFLNNFEEPTGNIPQNFQKKSPSIKAIENNFDLDKKSNTNYFDEHQHFKVIHPGDGSMFNKRRRSTEDFDDFRSHTSSYRLEKKND